MSLQKKRKEKWNILVTCNDCVTFVVESTGEDLISMAF